MNRNILKLVTISKIKMEESFCCFDASEAVGFETSSQVSINATIICMLKNDHSVLAQHLKEILA